MILQKKNEIAYYPEIAKFIEIQLQSNFAANGINEIKIFWRSGELTSNIRNLINEQPNICNCLNDYCRTTPPLNLDIFGIITNGIKFELIILEVKLRKSVGLSEWSQLIGYNLVGNAKYGLLININAGASKRLTGILLNDSNYSKIIRITSSGKKFTHLLSFMQWNSITQNFEYSNLGQIATLSELSKNLIEDFK